MPDILPFKVIQCKDHIYISKGSLNGYYIDSLYFDGQKGEKTYKSDWLKLPQIPETVERPLPKGRMNIRYELKDGYPETPLTPAILPLNTLYDSQYEEVAGLYTQKYDEVDGGFEPLEFTIDIIYKQDDFEWIQAKYASTPSLLSQIEFHPDLLQEVPCMYDSKRMFAVIRDYVKKYIDKAAAIISSDYDFHFEVKKKVQILEPYTSRYDSNAFGKNKRPKWVEKFVNSREETILNLKSKESDSGYGTNCTVAPALYGKNQADLDQKLDEYLANLIAEINIPYKECPHCKGWGVVKVGKDGEENI